MLLPVIVAGISVIVSSFSLGYSLAMYLTSNFRIRDEVEKRLGKELASRCELCQLRRAATEMTSEHNETIRLFHSIMLPVRKQGPKEKGGDNHGI